MPRLSGQSKKKNDPQLESPLKFHTLVIQATRMAEEYKFNYILSYIYPLYNHIYNLSKNEIQRYCQYYLYQYIFWC